MTFQLLWNSYHKSRSVNQSTDRFHNWHIWVHRRYWEIEYWHDAAEREFDRLFDRFPLCDAARLDWIKPYGNIYVEPFDGQFIACTACFKYLKTGRLKQVGQSR